MPQVGIIGAGLIGRAWAIVFARAGWDAMLYDADPAQSRRAKALIAAGLSDLAAHGLLDAAGAQSAAARVRLAADLPAAVARADFVQENLPETVEAKTGIFRELDRLAPQDIVLASSTSAIVASLFTADLPGRARCLVAHPVNPPHLVPLVELVGAPWTAAGTIARAKAVYEQVGQVPIVVRREIEGFILNRLQGALIAEAFRLVGEGYVSPQDLDKTVKDGLGLRWSFLGPFETIELNAPGGIPDYCARYGGFYRRLQAAPAGPEVFGPANIERVLAQWGEQANPERLEARARWRDKRLAALIAHKRSQPNDAREF
jgi:L-gulonate 3-dehydrogenase